MPFRPNIVLMQGGALGPDLEYMRIGFDPIRLFDANERTNQYAPWAATLGAFPLAYALKNAH